MIGRSGLWSRGRVGWTGRAGCVYGFGLMSMGWELLGSHWGGFYWGHTEVGIAGVTLGWGLLWSHLSWNY